jgi:protein gp37
MKRVLIERRLPVLPNVWLGTSVESEKYASRVNDLRSVPAGIRFVSFEPLLGPVGSLDLKGIHWAIVGGESGPRARPMEEGWVESVREQCEDQNVEFFFKQWGGHNKKAAGRRYRGRIWSNFPTVATV